MSAPPQIGTEVRDYRIEALIGEGGMSVVYRARRTSDGGVVALKLMAPELARSTSFRDRFLRESRVVTGLAHPNIVPVYEAGEAEGTFFIAMRLIEGPDLKELIEQEGRLDPSRAVATLRQVASALDTAHEAGMVHRDVKPQNILLERRADAGPEDAFLCDFGLTIEATSQSRLTQTGELVGSTHYMAPEQIEGRRDIDRRADVYALGCVLYEALTGKVPYAKDTEVAVLWAHMNSTPPSLTSRVRELPRGVDDVVATALAKTPSERFASCGELIAAFEQEAAGITTKSLVKRVRGSMVVQRDDLWKGGPASPRLALKVAPPRRDSAGLPWVIGFATLVIALIFFFVGTQDGGRVVQVFSDAVTGTDEPEVVQTSPQADALPKERQPRDRRGGTKEGKNKTAKGNGNSRARESQESAVAVGDDGQPVAEAGVENEPVSALPVMPTSGTYGYRMNGYEQICSNIGGCDEGAYPESFAMEATRRLLAEDRAQVTTTARYSDRWSASFTTEYRHDGAVITGISMTFDTDVSWTAELTPDRELDWLRYPLSRGQKWDLDWADVDDADEGTFRVEMGKRENLTVAGERIHAQRFHYWLDWQDGQNPSNSLDAEVWLDPRTNVVVKTVGTMKAGPSHSYYRYSFVWRLRSGPGY